MPSLTTYRGLQVVTPDPTGDGGLAIQNDLKSLVDWSPKSVWAQSADPGVNDDSTQSFYPGSLWLRTNTSPSKLFVCQSSSPGAAVWKSVLLAVVLDSSPQLGGNLDVNGKTITSTSNGDVAIAPNGTGNVMMTNVTITGGLRVGDTVTTPTPGGMLFAIAGTGEPFMVYSNGSGASKLGQIRGIDGGGLKITNGAANTIWATFDTNGLNLGSGAQNQKLRVYANGNTIYGLGIGSSTMRVFCASNGNLVFGSISTADGTTFVERVRMPGGGNLLIGTSTNVSANGIAVLVFGDNGATDPTMGASTVGLWSNGGELRTSGSFKHRQTLNDITAATDGATVTFDLATSDMHAVTLGGNRTLALSNAKVGQKFQVTLTQDATGGRTVTWWSGIAWAGGTVPTLTSTASKSDVFEFICTASGTYFGRVWGQNF